jgi:hypothetical protein
LLFNYNAPMVKFFRNKSTDSAATPVKGGFLAGLFMQQELTNQ